MQTVPSAPSRADAVGLNALLTEAPCGRVLGNGRYAALVTAAGAGFAACDGLALTRWRGDRLADGDGYFVYLRDLDGGSVWSAGYEPTRRAPDAYSVRFDPHPCITREDEGVASRLEVAVAKDAPAEVRRLTLTNRSGRPRRIDVTTYAEVALNDRLGDLGHPAFSKLFVETERVSGRPVLLARRRPRSPEDPTPWLVHALLGDGKAAHEADRMRFVGRGRDLAAPRALDAGAALSGTTGAVLDPIVSLRRTVTLHPGEAVTLHLLLGAAGSRAEAVALADRFAEAAAVDTVFEGAEYADTAAHARLLYGVAVDDEDVVRAAAGALGVPDGFLPPATAPAAGAPRASVRRAEPATVRPRFGDGKPFDSAPPGLRLFNGYGGFSEDGREYVVSVRRDIGGVHRLPPLPWANVVANERAGFIVTERGGGTTWAGNSRTHRLTPWLNDPVTDASEEALYVRDDGRGAFWSPTPGPAPAPADYEVRHGFGYTRFTLETGGLRHATTQFVPVQDPVKLTRVRVTNTGEAPRRLSLFHYARLVLGDRPEATGSHVVTEAYGGALLARNPEAGAFAEAVAFAAVAGADETAGTTDRAAFVGRHRGLGDPRAVAGAARLDGAAGAGVQDPCFALQATLTLAPGQTREVVFLLGEGADRGEALALLARYGAPGAAEAALEAVRARWQSLLGAVQVATPEPALDLMVNGWLLYQDVACRLWGRSAYYQSGGAYGFRDQLQDAAALAYVSPALLREQILRHAAHQFVEGDVLHWWHPPTSEGLRTRFADDLLWLPYVAAFYVNSTGDAALLDAEAPFLTADRLEDGEDERYLQPEPGGQSASVYEHCCRAIDRSLTRGAHGLPLMGTGDWNDGMNRVGREGRGESVWLGFFLFAILGAWVPLCEARGDGERAHRYRAHREHLASALNASGAGWDGGWYRRAYYDSGAVLGSAESDEGQIDALAQAWAVLSGAAPPDKVTPALDAMEARLVDEDAGLIRLLTPPFDVTPNDPGYIKGYIPGVRENGGQYTHAALWAVRALAAAGRRDRAARLLAMLSPVAHTATAEGVERYRAEPYVVAADVYGVAPHVGRGGWTWYTGSAGWMWRVAVESVVGLGLEDGERLTLRPCLPDAWPGVALRYRLPGEETAYHVAVDNPDGCAEAVVSAEVDGEAAEVVGGTVRVPLRHDGGTHHVRVVLGSAS